MDGSEASRVLKEKQRLKSLVSSGDRDGLAAFFGSTSPLIPAIGLVLKDIQAKDWNWKPTAQDLAVLRARLDAVICEPEEPKIPAPNTSADQQATPRPQREASGDYNDNIDNTITTKRKKRDGEGRDHAAAPRKRARKSLDQQAIEEGQAFLKSPAGEIRRSLRTRNRPDRS